MQESVNFSPVNSILVSISFSGPIRDPKRGKAKFCLHYREKQGHRRAMGQQTIPGLKSEAMEQNFACGVVLRLENSHTKGQESCLKWNLSCRKLKMKERVF